MTPLTLEEFLIAEEEMRAEIEELKAENERLKADIEYLKKAHLSGIRGWVKENEKLSLRLMLAENVAESCSIAVDEKGDAHCNFDGIALRDWRRSRK